MPGKCKFQDAWLNKDIYKDWLLRDFQDIHLARCRACCKLIKLQTMGEAALTSHAAGAHHKAAVRRLMLAQGHIMMINVAENGDGSINMNEDSKEHVAICLQRDSLDRTTGNAWSELHHSPSANSISHNAEFQEVEFPTASIASPESLEQQERADALSQEQQQQQMKLLEWESRMKVLEWEQEVLREKRRAARQKEKAFRMKKTYYQAKLKKMGQDVPPSSSSSGDEEDKPSHHTG